MQESQKLYGWIVLYSEEKVVTITNPLKVVGFISLALTILSGIFPGIFSNLGEASAIFFSS